MNALLEAIREAPLSYLPRVSLEAFAHFQNGYSVRRAMEGYPHDWGYDRREFQQWLCESFQLAGTAAIADTTIVSSYSVDEADAFHRYFSLLEKFLSLGNERSQSRTREEGKKDFVGIMRAIRERPALYLGHTTFRGCCSYLLGDDHAYRDLKLGEDDGRVLFHDFQRWVEKGKNQGLSRPWFRVIEFYSMGMDCGHTQRVVPLRFFLNGSTNM